MDRADMAGGQSGKSARHARENGWRASPSAILKYCCHRRERDRVGLAWHANSGRWRSASAGASWCWRRRRATGFVRASTAPCLCSPQGGCYR